MNKEDSVKKLEELIDSVSVPIEESSAAKRSKKKLNISGRISALLHHKKIKKVNLPFINKILFALAIIILSLIHI